MGRKDSETVQSQEFDISRNHMVTKAKLPLNLSKTSHPKFPCYISCVTLPLDTDSASQLRMATLSNELFCSFCSRVTESKIQQPVQKVRATQCALREQADYLIQTVS